MNFEILFIWPWLWSDDLVLKLELALVPSLGSSKVVTWIGTDRHQETDSTEIIPTRMYA